MSAITWIIIILIIISILVTVTEVGLRFAMLERTKGEKKGDDPAFMISDGGSGTKGPAILLHPSPPQMLDGSGVSQDVDGSTSLVDEASMSDLEILAQELGLLRNASLSDVRRGIWELKRQSGEGATQGEVDL